MTSPPLTHLLAFRRLRFTFNEDIAAAVIRQMDGRGPPSGHLSPAGFFRRGPQRPERPDSFRRGETERALRDSICFNTARFEFPRGCGRAQSTYRRVMAHCGQARSRAAENRPGLRPVAVPHNGLNNQLAEMRQRFSVFQRSISSGDKYGRREKSASVRSQT